MLEAQQLTLFAASAGCASAFRLFAAVERLTASLVFGVALLLLARPVCRCMLPQMTQYLPPARSCRMHAAHSAQADSVAHDCTQHLCQPGVSKWSRSSPPQLGAI